MPNQDIPIIEPYNPLDKRNLCASITAATLSSPVHNLAPKPFIGAGIYVLYYRGNFPPYSLLSKLNEDSYNVPIYIGKAVPAGARKGGSDLNTDHGLALYNRLSEHYTSISKAINLNVDDFACRYLVLDEIWIALAESMIIDMYQPLWNVCLEGFGNHDPGKGRYQQQKSPWDCIHEGREWADKLRPNNLSKEEILEKVSAFMLKHYGF